MSIKANQFLFYDPSQTAYPCIKSQRQTYIYKTDCVLCDKHEIVIVRKCFFLFGLALPALSSFTTRKKKQKKKQ